ICDIGLEFGRRVDLHGFPSLLGKGTAKDDGKPNLLLDHPKHRVTLLRLVDDPDDARHNDIRYPGKALGIELARGNTGLARMIDHREAKAVSIIGYEFKLAGYSQIFRTDPIVDDKLRLRKGSKCCLR